MSGATRSKRQGARNALSGWLKDGRKWIASARASCAAGQRESMICVSANALYLVQKEGVYGVYGFSV
jgi:hypothetical protein